MKKLVIALMLAMILALVVAAPVMADGPGNPGYGNDPNIQPDPDTRNEVFVPQKAFDARGEFPPGNPDSHGAIFKPPEIG